MQDIQKYGLSFNWQVRHSGKMANGYCNTDGQGNITEFKQQWAFRTSGLGAIYYSGPSASEGSLNQLKGIKKKIMGGSVAPEGSVSGSPDDYSSDLYRVYFEVGEHEGVARGVIADYFGPLRSQDLVTLAHSYEYNLPVQAVSDLVRALSRENIAVYQVLRIYRVAGRWT